MGRTDQWLPGEQRIVATKYRELRPLRTHECTASIDRGWGGVGPLPVRVVPHGFQSAWVVPKQSWKALKANGGVISVVILNGPGGQRQVSIVVPEVEMETPQ